MHRDGRMLPFSYSQLDGLQTIGKPIGSDR
jgi:hypothetical protein